MKKLFPVCDGISGKKLSRSADAKLPLLIALSIKKPMKISDCQNYLHKCVQIFDTWGK